ncbi:MAG: Rrf2 family transcriptional regulator [Flavobacteriales bacterium]|nr:Rrf2 family transcriptional regulator [Flavobacteriales bacterium]MBP9079370.1 Rrf2 family transcriptional regulator [Flavobacteriales bacterium]
MFSKTGEYALRATMVIATASRNGERLTLERIAERTGMPKAFTAKVLQDLVRGGVMASSRGPNGGFDLTPLHARKVNLRKVLDAVGEADITNSCVMGLGGCNKDLPCPMHKDFIGIKQAIASLLDRTQVHDLVDDLNKGETYLKR